MEYSGKILLEVRDSIPTESNYFTIHPNLGFWKVPHGGISLVHVEACHWLMCRQMYLPPMRTIFHVMLTVLLIFLPPICHIGYTMSTCHSATGPLVCLPCHRMYCHVLCMDDTCQIFIGTNGPLKIPFSSDMWHTVVLPCHPIYVILL